MDDATVLVVDDDAAIRELLALFLSERNFCPLSMRSGQECIEYLEQGLSRPDIILLDLLMPGIDGYQVLDYIRRQQLNDLPVLVLSALEPRDEVLTTLDSRHRDFVRKPFDLDELLVRMERLLRDTRPNRDKAEAMLHVHALGSLRVTRGDMLLFDETWRHRPAKTIFKILFSSRGRRCTKDALAEALWPESDSSAAANRIRVSVHDLRGKLRDGRGAQVQLILQQEGTYYFNRHARVWSDVDDFQERSARGKQLERAGDRDAALREYQEAIALYQGDYLHDDSSAEWSIGIRERLREEHLRVLAATAQAHANLGNYEAAIDYARRILRQESWREDVCRSLMEYLAAIGQRNEALKAYDALRDALRTEVDTEPMEETNRLRERIARGGPARSDASA